MEQSLFEEGRAKKRTLLLAVCLFGISLFYAVVCTPISLLVSSDILLSDTALPLLLDVLMLLCNYLFYWIAFSVTLYGIYRTGLGACKGVFAVYACAVLFRYSANMTAGFFVIGFPTSDVFFRKHFPYLLIDIVLDLVLIALVAFVVCKIQKKQKDFAMEKAFPIVKLFDRKSMFLHSVICVAAIPAAVQLISRVIYDISYGAPTSIIDLLWMIVSYASDVANLFIGYLVIVLLLNRLHLREAKAQLDYHSATVL